MTDLCILICIHIHAHTYAYSFTYEFLFKYQYVFIADMGFRPPPKLQKYTSMISCYHRFRSSSKYIAFLDDNEFVGIHVDNK